MPPSGDLGQFVAAVSAHRGRPAIVVAADLDPDAPSGLWLQMAEVDYIVHAKSVTGEHRSVVICHEIAHMLLDHQPAGSGIDTSTVAPSIAPDVAARFFTRHGYDNAAEADAEALATVLATRLAAHASTSSAAIRTLDHVSERLR